MRSGNSIRPSGGHVKFNYRAYLASREWGLLKRQVRERSGGKCERCGAPQEVTHHVTYERLGHERLDDLLAVCKQCHDYLSGITDLDPVGERQLSDAELLGVLNYLELVAQKHADGHLTLMRFSTGWKISFGTPDMSREWRDWIWELRSFPTLRDLALATFRELRGADM